MSRFTNLRRGRLRHLVTIEHNQGEIRDEHNRIKPKWVAVGRRYASIRQLRGREIEEAQQSKSEANAMIVMHYTSLIKPTARIRHAGKTYEVSGINNTEGRNKKLEITAIERWDAEDS